MVGMYIQLFNNTRHHRSLISVICQFLSIWDWPPKIKTSLWNSSNINWQDNWYQKTKHTLRLQPPLRYYIKAAWSCHVATATILTHALSAGAIFNFPKYFHVKLSKLQVLISLIVMCIYFETGSRSARSAIHQKEVISRRLPMMKSEVARGRHRIASP